MLDPIYARIENPRVAIAWNMPNIIKDLYKPILTRPQKLQLGLPSNQRILQQYQFQFL